jgi:two-component system, OmpR family, sensor histidine kinase VicK
MSVRAPQDELLRTQALEQYGILKHPPDPALDEIVRLAAQICDCPVGGIALSDGNRQVYKSVLGLRVFDQHDDKTPCEATLLAEEILEIQDALSHPSFASEGILLGIRSFRFYAGAPLTTPLGVRIGCLFVMDPTPRVLAPQQASALTLLGRQVITRFELTGRDRQINLASRARQRIDSALTVERNFVSAVLDTVAAPIVVFDTAGRIVRFNRACEAVSGYNFDELVGGYLWDKLIPPQDIPESLQRFKHLRDSGLPVAFESRWMRPDGSLRRIAWSATVLRDSHQQVAFLIGTGIDVTAEHAAEDTLRESEARYRMLVEGSLGMVCTHDLNGVLLSVNTHGAESLGRVREEMIGHPLDEFMPEEVRGGMPPYLHRLATTGAAQGTLHLSHRNGETLVIAYSNKLIQMSDREPYVLGFGIDITEKVRAEDRLRTLIRQSNSILESVGDGIFGIDLEGKVTVINPAAAQMLGYKPQELLGRTMHHITHHTRADGSPYPIEECPITNSLKNLVTARVSDEVFWRRDGTSIPVDYVARPQIDPGSEQGGGTGTAVGVVVAFTDVTERQALDRMKDNFISTVSHELRTPLTSLRAALGLICGGALASRPDKMRQMLDIATANTERLVHLVNDILDLERISSGKAELHATMCSAEDLLRRAAAIEQTRARTRAAKAPIQFTFDAANVGVWGDPDRILQTLTNLISNAIKFSPPGSVIHLAARPLPDDEAQIEVHDHGRGIPLDKLEQVFERFQQIDASDSRSMGGTGLGLAICRSIVTQHGGRIWASSTPGEVTTFYFTLPTRPSRSLR